MAAAFFSDLVEELKIFVTADGPAVEKEERGAVSSLAHDPAVGLPISKWKIFFCDLHHYFTYFKQLHF